MTKCPVCEGERWVCEFHGTPWRATTGCDECGGAGVMCPKCNSPDPQTVADAINATEFEF